DVRADNGFAAVGFEEESFKFGVARANDEGQIAHPKIAELNLVVGFIERRVEAAHEEIETGLEGIRGADRLDAFAEIGGRRERSRPCQSRRALEQLFALRL